MWLYPVYYETAFSLEYLLPQQQVSPLTRWDVFRSKITSKGVSLKLISGGEICHTKAIGCVEFSCHPMLPCYPVILIQTSVSTFCLYCKPFRKETSHLSWYCSSGWHCKTYQHEYHSMPTEMPCRWSYSSPVFLYIPDAVAFLPVFNMIQQLADGLDACGAFGVHASSPPHPAAGTKSVMPRVCSKVLLTEWARPCCVLDHV